MLFSSILNPVLGSSMVMFLWALVLTRFNLSNCRRSSPEIPRLGALCALPALNLSAARATIPQTLAARQEGRQKHTKPCSEHPETRRRFELYRFMPELHRRSFEDSSRDRFPFGAGMQCSNTHRQDAIVPSSAGAVVCHGHVKQ